MSCLHSSFFSKCKCAFSIVITVMDRFDTFHMPVITISIDLSSLVYSLEILSVIDRHKV